VVIALLAIQYIYQPVTSGTLYLTNAIRSIDNTSIEIYREKESGIAHVFY